MNNMCPYCYYHCPFLLNRLNDNEDGQFDMVQGNTCWYDGVEYSPGAQVSMNDTQKWCWPDGTWKTSQY